MLINPKYFIFSAVFLAACGGDNNTVDTEASDEDLVVTSVPAPAVNVIPDIENCDPEDGIEFLCGVVNGEDILRLGDSDWLLVSGMDGSLTGTDIRGKIHLVNAVDKSAEILFPGLNPVFQHDTQRYGDCPGPVNTESFSAHGLALQESDKGPDIYRLYMTSHGEREAIEVFEVEAFVKPSITWIGCIPMPASSWTNSVAMLSDGGFVATQFYNPAEHTIGDVLAGDITGHVFEWHPGEEVRVIPGTELSGGNGIVISEDERWIYAASFGTGELVRFDLSSSPPIRVEVPLGILGDNIRWSSRGTLLSAGNNTDNFCGQPPCETGWGVVEITPDDLVATRIVAVGEDSALRDPSTALLVNGDIWVGTYGGDRLAIIQP